MNNPRVLEVVLGTVPDFINFHIHLPTLLWQLRCFVERIIRKRLSDSYIHNSAIVRLSANSSCVSRRGQRLCQTQDVKLSCYSSVCYCGELQRQMILKLTIDVQDWIAFLDFGKQNCNISFSQKPIIWFPDLLFKFINGFDTVWNFQN